MPYHFRNLVDFVKGIQINGTSMTSSAAELNLLDTATAGTVVASKAVIAGASKNLDTLAIADGGLKLGADAGTAVTATAAELNMAADQTSFGTDGLGSLHVARFTFDPSATEGMRTVAAHGLGVTIPIQAVVVGGFVEVNTAFTSANANNGTVAISVQSGDDIIAAAAVSGAPYSSTGLKAIVPKANTPETTGIKLTAAREITATVGTSALTAGKLTGFLYYVVSAATA